MSTPKDSILTLLQMLETEPIIKALLSGAQGLKRATSPAPDTMPQAENFLKSTAGPTPDFGMMIPAAGVMKALPAPKAVQSVVKPFMGSAEHETVRAAVPFLEDVGSYGGFAPALYMRFNPTKGPMISKEFTQGLRDIVQSLGYQAEITPLHSSLAGGVKQLRIDVFDDAGRKIDGTPLLSKLQEMFGFK